MEERKEDLAANGVGASAFTIRTPILNDDSHNPLGTLCAVSTTRALGVSREEQKQIGASVFVPGDQGGFVVAWSKLLQIAYAKQLGGQYSVVPGGSLAEVDMSHVIVGVVNISGGVGGTGHAVALIRHAQDGPLYMYNFGRKSLVTPLIWASFGSLASFGAAICETRHIKPSRPYHHHDIL